MKPTRLQYVLARASWISIWCGAVAGAFIAGRSLPVSPTLLRNPTFVFWFLFVVLVGFALGWFLSFLFISPFVALLASQFNGAPYVVGDLVHILVGSNRDRVVQVYKVWHERRQMRVELGDQGSRSIKDVYSYDQVCRERDV